MKYKKYFIYSSGEIDFVNWNNFLKLFSKNSCIFYNYNEKLSRELFIRGIVSIEISKETVENKETMKNIIQELDLELVIFNGIDLEILEFCKKINMVYCKSNIYVYDRNGTPKLECPRDTPNDGVQIKEYSYKNSIELICGNCNNIYIPNKYLICLDCNKKPLKNYFVENIEENHDKHGISKRISSEKKLNFYNEQTDKEKKQQKLALLEVKRHIFIENRENYIKNMKKNISNTKYEELVKQKQKSETKLVSNELTLCKAFTKGGKQCSNKSVGYTNYCGIISHRKLDPNYKQAPVKSENKIFEKLKKMSKKNVTNSIEL